MFTGEIYIKIISKAYIKRTIHAKVYIKLFNISVHVFYLRVISVVVNFFFNPLFFKHPSSL